MTPNFQTMTRQELRNYLLEHRDNTQAFYAYMDRLAKAPILAIHSPSDSEPLSEVITRIQKQKKS
ncbi:MAG: hypothetical protein J7647_06055 [Cyanobacteria bacterium SBLK]|nr:hypothetical protein [Cyanobacteria bacterium SBLK]